MSIPLNRVVAFAGPYVSVISGGVATWLVAKANVLGIDGLDEANLATQVGGALTFVLVAVLSWVGQSRWLTGAQVELRADARVASAALTAPSAPPPAPPASFTPPPPAPPWPQPLATAAPPAAFAPAPPAPPAAFAPPPPAPSAAFAPAPTPPQPGELSELPALLEIPDPPEEPLDEPPPEGEAGGDVPPTIVDEALPHDAPATDAGDLAAAEATAAEDPAADDDDGDEIPDGTPDELRPVMPSEEPLQGELDEHDDDEEAPS